MMFSATFPRPIQKLAQDFMNQSVVQPASSFVFVSIDVFAIVVICLRGCVRVLEK